MGTEPPVPEAPRAAIPSAGSPPAAVALARSRALVGARAPAVSVEVHLANGLPAFALVGLAEAEVREARERVRAAILNCGFDFPARRITVSLAPADLPKESGRYDLPIAIGILAASGQLPGADLDRWELAGELGLGGALRPVRGAIPMAWGALGDGRGFVLPAASAAEAARVPGASVHAATGLQEVCAHLMELERLPRCEAPAVPAAIASGAPDLVDVRGQPQARRALEVAAAGGHSLLLAGPPGSGKTMLASRLPGILPAMTPEEAIESAAVQSLAPGGFDAARWGQRPFRAPHHTASAVALVGGGALPRPGEVSLAQNGVLFLDELPEFDRRVLEVLREPLETGRIMVSRAARQAEFPARFQLVAAMNPCPCGWAGDASGRCRCGPSAIARYQRRVSGPLLDRIDLAIEVPAVEPAALAHARAGDNSATVRSRVETARARQLSRQALPNSALDPAGIERHCPLEAAALAVLERAAVRLALSARAFGRIRRVARTIADLAAEPSIGAAHVAEAIQLRRFDPGRGGD
jgi:magnesium chelatase family protein